jgi:hypothetical protein
MPFIDDEWWAGEQRYIKKTFRIQIAILCAVICYGGVLTAHLLRHRREEQRRAAAERTPDKPVGNPKLSITKF